MNDTLREYFSYGKFILPYLKYRKQIEPQKIHFGGKDQYFLHFPSPCKRKNTLIIYYHGGGWNSNSPKLHAFIGQKLALEGFDCIMPGYRKAPKARYCEIADDVHSGYQAIGSYLAKENLSYDKIIVMGSSAGAHLGALLCYDVQMLSSFAPSLHLPDAFISLAGPLAFSPPMTGALRILLKGLFNTNDTTKWTIGEPIRKLHEKPGFRQYIIHSPHDGLVNIEQARAFHEKALSLGIASHFYEVTDSWNTHSAYCAGIFLQDKANSLTLAKVLQIAESI